MEANFSQRVKDVLTYSREEAMRLGNDYIGIEHLMLGIIRDGEGVAIQITCLSRSKYTSFKNETLNWLLPKQLKQQLKKLKTYP